MGGKDQRYTLQVLRDAARKVGVPRVAVDDIDSRQLAAHHKVLQQRRKELLVPWIVRGKSDGRLHALNPKSPRLLLLIAKAEPLDRIAPAIERSQFTGEVLDVDARAAVHVRRVLVRE